ncbi:MAG TPA: EamA family transporter [Acidobacteriaceae bacterium]|jgi:drug/metabolite transporter (DMT)-like permease
MAMSQKTIRLLAYGAIYVFWGGSFLAIRDMVAVTPPLFSAGIRFFLAGVALYAFSRWRGSPRVRGRALVNSLFLGVLLFTCSYGCLFWAETRIDSGTAAVIAAMIPIWILLGEVLLFRTQRLSLSVAGATLLGILGVAMVTRSIGFKHAMVNGVLVELAGTVIFSFATLWSRALTLPDDQGARAGLQMALGSVGLFVISALAGETPRIPAAFAAWQWHTVISLVYLVTCASILAFTSYTWLIHHEPATRVASYAYVNPLIALIVGVTLGGEHVSALQAAGAALIIFGVAATMLSKSAAPVAKSSTADSIAAR